MSPDLDLGDNSGEVNVSCGACGAHLAGPFKRGDLPECPSCGPDAERRVKVRVEDTVRVHAYARAVGKPEPPDKSKPYGGGFRLYSGHRVGRDGRLVQREALYDDASDTARERVVDSQTGEVIVDKTEPAEQKARARGWKPKG